MPCWYVSGYLLQSILFGHWEVGTVIGSKRKEDPVLLTLVERMTHYTLILKIKGKTETTVLQAMAQLASIPHASLFFKTITADNGLAFSGLEKCIQEISDVYFTHPYSSCERESNEKHNDIIRRFIPKGLLLSNISTKTLRSINTWLNALPRKIFNYLTPSDILSQNLPVLTAT